MFFDPTDERNERIRVESAIQINLVVIPYYSWTDDEFHVSRWMFAERGNAQVISDNAKEDGIYVETKRCIPPIN